MFHEYNSPHNIQVEDDGQLFCCCDSFYTCEHSLILATDLCSTSANCDPYFQVHISVPNLDTFWYIESKVIMNKNYIAFNTISSDVFINPIVVQFTDKLNMVS